jgi:uncharacterized protein (TIGR02452 family)
LSFLTAPAVNAGVVKRNEPENIPHIGSVMVSRIEKVLALAFLHKHKTLILGAWGCGVFQNDPQQIAQYFAQHLLTGKYKNAFEEVVFAIKQRTKSLLNRLKIVLSIMIVNGNRASHNPRITI